MSKTHEAFLTSSGTPFGALTNTVPSKPRQPPQVLPSTPLWQTPVAHHYGHHQTHLQTPDVPQSREPHEQTDSLLSSRSSQSSSRHQRAADPRRESTVLFNGFSASTAESGLLEVDEIAHINGSPELVKDSHPNTSPAESTTVKANRGVPEHMALPKQAVSTGPAAAALAQQSQGRASQAADTGGMRRSVGMRDSMCLFLQLEGAVEGENGFEPEEVLQLDEVRRLSGSKASLPVVPEEEEEEPPPQPQSPVVSQQDTAVNTAAGGTQQDPTAGLISVRV
ncbi:hypothetical protein WJX79_010313 [Trebouxia sp. C0005]